MSGFNMPPGVSPSDIPGNEPSRRPMNNPEAELTAKQGTLTVKEILDFLLLVSGAHPEVLERELNYVFDGEFYNFSKITFEGETVLLHDNA